MASIFTTSIESNILSFLLSRLPLRPLDIPQQSSFTLKGNSGPSLHLTNIILDIDNLQSQYLPSSTPFNIRHAFVKDLKIIINTNGIQILVEGVDCVVSPKATNENGELLDPTNSIILKGLEDPLEGLEGMMESVVGFVDAVSGINSFSSNGKAETTEWGDEIGDDDDDDDKKEDEEIVEKTAKSLKSILKNDLELNEDLQKNLENAEKSSNNNSLINFAINYILSKISVSIDTINIKTVADPIILNLKINNIASEGDKSNRKCTITGVVLSVLKPKHEQDKDSYYEDNSKGSDEDASDYNDDLMSSSFMAESKEQFERSILESAMYSASGKSLYMSATQGDLDSKSANENINNKSEDGDILFLIDSINILLKQRQSISIKLEKIKISLVNIPSLASAFITLLIQIGKQKTIVANKPLKTNNKEKANPNIVLEIFQIEDLEVSLNSKLNEVGQFVIPDSYILHCSDFSLQQRSPTLIQGSLKTFEIHNGRTKLFYFDDKQSNQTDIRIEMQVENKSHITSVVLSKPLLFEIPYDFLELLIEYYNKLNELWDKIEELKIMNLKKQRSNKSLPLSESLSRAPPDHSNKGKNNRLNVEVSFRLNKVNGSASLSKDDSKIYFSITPSIYDSIKKVLSIDFIKLTIITPAGKSHLDINKIRYTDHREENAKFTSFDVNSSKSVINYTKKTITLDSINFNSSYEVVNTMMEIATLIKLKFTKPILKEKMVQFDKPSLQHKLMASFFLKPKVLDLYLYIRSFTFSITKINSEFGGIIGECSSIGLTKSSDSEAIFQLSIPNILINRLTDDTKEIIIKKPNKWGNSPMLFAKFQNSINIFLNNILINYNGKWLSMFEGKTEENLTFETKITNLMDNTARKARKRINREIYVSLTDVCIGLKPVNLQSEGIIIINKANSNFIIYNDKHIIIQLTSNSIDLYLIDDIMNLKKSKTKEVSDWNISSIFENMGYVKIGLLSTILIKLNLRPCDSETLKLLVDLQLNIEKVESSLCCDSAQCFIQLIKDLKTPVFFSYSDKYKDKNEKDLDIFKNIDLNFFDTSRQKLLASAKEDKKLRNQGKFQRQDTHIDENDDLTIVENFYDKINKPSIDSNINNSAASNIVSSSSFISFRPDHFENNESTTSSNNNLIPFNLHLNISEIDLNLYDGYDWKDTRIQIKQAFQRISDLAKNVKNVINDELNDVPEEIKPDFVIEERLYQSILVEMGPNDNPRKIYNQMAEKINGTHHKKLEQTIDLGKSKSRPLKLHRSNKYKTLIKFEDVDINFNLKSTNEPHLKKKPDYFDNIDDNNSEIVNEIEISIYNFQILDNVPTSSWNMFVGYMREFGEREVGKSMIKINIELVRPINKLAAIEMILNINILPLRLYIDQDTLDFITRFGGFKDQRFIPTNCDLEEIFIQKLVINAIKLKLDYKPKKIDYAGIRSGHTNEFMNFFILDGSEITLNKVKLYGISGFSKLNTILNGYWSPDIRKNQLPNVLSGIGPFRSIINIGLGFNSLVSSPIKEYKKNGRIIRSLQVGAIEFTKNTSTEILKLGAKLAAGTQTILENTEEVLGGTGSLSRVVISKDDIKDISATNNDSSSDIRRRSSATSFADEDESDYHRYFFRKNGLNAEVNDTLEIHYEEECAIDDDDESKEDEEENGEISSEDGEIRFNNNGEIGYYNNNDNNSDGINREKYIISLYSNQPKNFNEGLKIAYKSIQRNFSTAKDAIYEASIKASESETTSEAVYELAKATPVIFIRPVIAATEAISKSLLGGVNDIDPDERQKANEKYKGV
jgi:autophagy-related protein 2